MLKFHGPWPTETKVIARKWCVYRRMTTTRQNPNIIRLQNFLWLYKNTYKKSGWLKFTVNFNKTFAKHINHTYHWICCRFFKKKYAKRKFPCLCNLEYTNFFYSILCILFFAYWNKKRKKKTLHHLFNLCNILLANWT